MARTNKQVRLPETGPRLSDLACLSLLLLLFLGAQGASAQDDDEEYQMEIGAGVGTDFYLGDVNSTPFSHASAMGGVIVRRVFNPRMVLKGDLAFGHLRGSSEGRFIPTDANVAGADGGLPTTVNFKRNVAELSAQFEFNFWGYGIGEAYKGNSRITPYVLAGLGVTVATGGGGGTACGANFPIGLGVKYKLKRRVNVGAEWTFRFTTTDALDVNGGQTSLSSPFAIKSSGLKNKDAYSFLMLFLTYDICPKCKACNNNN